MYQLQVVAELDGTNGISPGAALLAGADGAFYGTAYSGGASNVGTIFRVTTEGVLTSVASFATTNGANPSAALVSGGDGLMYGTTSEESSSLKGTVFKVATNGNLTTLTNFTSFTGKTPKAALTPGGGGVFYGTTSSGLTFNPNSKGTVFKVTTNGSLTTLVDFDGTNGAFPKSALVFGNDGLLYGTTSQGGTFDRGTAFSLTTNGTLTKLATFDGTNGWQPNTLLPVDNHFFGTTYRGGVYNYGTVFKMNTNGAITLLASFDGTNGAFPNAALVSGNDGVYYGTTYQGGGGVLGKGTLFSITTNGNLTTLAIFNGTNGANPSAALVLGADGSFWGTASSGGAYTNGTVFRLSLVPPMLNISSLPGMVVLGWTNSTFSLQSAPDVTGVYTNIPGAGSPFTSSITGERQFFRLQK